MAGIETQNNGKRRLVRPDMTAMVDVAFLLLMFFVLTAATVKLSSTPLNMPAGDGHTDINCKKMCTVFLAGNDEVWVQKGCEAQLEKSGFGNEGLRSVLTAQGQAQPDLIVRLVPLGTSRYENLVDAIDELRITRTAKWAVAEPIEEEISLLRQNGIQHQ